MTTKMAVKAAETYWWENCE